MKVRDVLVKVYEPGRLKRTWQRVSTNAGAAGRDQMTVEEFAQWDEHLLVLIHAMLKSGHYCFQPARRVLIPERWGSIAILVEWIWMGGGLMMPDNVGPC